MTTESIMDPFSTIADHIHGRINHVISSVRALFAIAHCAKTELKHEHCKAAFGEICPSENLIDNIRENGIRAVHAAALVFVHSACENAINDLMKHILNWDGDAVLDKLLSKKIAFREAKDHHIKTVQQRLQNEWLKHFSDLSLPKKVDLFFSIVQPSRTDQIEGFSYCQIEFEKVDCLRHKCVHNSLFIDDFADINVSILFLINTFKLLVELSKEKYQGTTPK